jgi:hypothetical protein
MASDLYLLYCICFMPVLLLTRGAASPVTPIHKHDIILCRAHRAYGYGPVLCLRGVCVGPTWCLRWACVVSALGLRCVCVGPTWSLL